MASTSLFCAACGAANAVGADECFACGQPLVAGQANFQRTMLKQRYLVLDLIGQGGFGAVYKAADVQFGDRLLAIKEMNQSGLSEQDMQQVEHFKQEAMLLAGLMHPNLPRIYDHFTENGRWYLVMDFIEGETLEDYLERSSAGRLPLTEVLAIGMQLCKVLDYLHARSIIFRDLKPSNVMRTPDGQLYLIDFGIARHFKPGQAKDTIAFGSPGYAAPEQYGKAQTTSSADIFSLGALLHQMLTGIDPSITPFCFESLHECGYADQAELEELLIQMVEIPASKRLAHASEVREQLQLISKGIDAQAGVQAAQTVSTTKGRMQSIVGSTPAEGDIQSIYRLHRDSVTSIVWSPDGTRIVSGDGDNTVHIWNALSGEKLAIYTDFSGQLRWRNGIAWSREGIHIILYTENGEKPELLWDKESGERIFVYYERRKKVGTVAWSPDNQYLALGNNDRMVQIRDVTRGESIFTYCGHRESLRLNRVNAVAWSPNGLYVASGTRGDGVHVWQIATGETIQTYSSHAAELITLAWSPDGHYIASVGSDDTIQVWEVASRRRIFTYHGHAGLDIGIGTVAWSPDGTRIASAGGGNNTSVQVWDAFNGGNVFTYDRHTGQVNALVWSPDGKYIASGGADATVHVWQAS